MRGQIEVLANQLETADKRQKDLYLDIDTRLRKLEQTREQQAAAAPTSRAAAEARGLARRDQGLPGGARPVQARQLLAAVSAMQGFLVTYPSSSARAQRAVLDRHGALGPARLQERDLGAEEAAGRWPDNPKAPDAMLSIASAQETMGARGEAQKTLRRADRALPRQQRRGERASSASPPPPSAERPQGAIPVGAKPPRNSPRT